MPAKKYFSEEERKAHLQYDNQRHTAGKRGIGFHLTFEQWFEFWQQSGHYAERGRKRGQYVMARFGDTGPYAIDNIFIHSAEGNAGDANKGMPVDPDVLKARIGKKRTEEFRQKMSALVSGEKNGMYGKPRTEEHKEHISKLMTGRKRGPYKKRKTTQGDK